MSRSLRELIDDYESDPLNWEVVEIETVAATARRNKGGTSVQELYQNLLTGETMVRHSLLRPDGSNFAAPHFRLEWK